MPEDRVTITADAGQYFDVLSRAGVAADRLGASGTRIGQGFVRGERAVRLASQNISAALLSASDATSTLLIAASGLERVFRIGIGPTVVVAAGVKAFEVLHEQVKKTKDAYDDLKKDLATPINVDPVTDATTRKIDELTEKLEKLRKLVNDPTTKTSGNLLALAGIVASAFLPQVLKNPVISVLAGAAPTGLGALDQISRQTGSRLEQLAAKRGQDILAAADKLHQALVDAVGKFRAGVANLFRDIGSGQFIKDLQQRNVENQQTQAGQDMVRQFEEDAAKGIALGPNAQAMVSAARAAAAKGGVGIRDILNADFSNLDLLSKYDFSGLAPLANMTIIVQ